MIYYKNQQQLIEQKRRVIEAKQAETYKKSLEKGLEGQEKSEIQGKEISDGTQLEKPETFSKISEVHEVIPKFNSLKELNDYKLESWEKLENTNLGKMFIKREGGVDNIKNNMQGGVRTFLTRSANTCEKIKDINPAEEGTLVHKLGELYALEKHPKSILRGAKFVEQSVSFTEKNGTKRRCEIDAVTIDKNGSVMISDYKRVNLSNFERTSAGLKWRKWASETIGPNFRDKIKEGADPLFTQERKMFPPDEIRKGFKQYMEKVENLHSEQLNKYKHVFSEGSGTPLENIKTTITPYYVFG